MKESIRGWSNEYYRLEEEKERVEEKLRKIYDYESRFGYISQQIEMMKQKLREKIIDVEYWKQKYNGLLLRVEQLMNQADNDLVQKWEAKVTNLAI